MRPSEILTQLIIAFIRGQPTSDCWKIQQIAKRPATLCRVYKIKAEGRGLVEWTEQFI